MHPTKPRFSFSIWRVWQFRHTRADCSLENANSRENFQGGAGTRKVQHPAAYVIHNIPAPTLRQWPNFATPQHSQSGNDVVECSHFAASSCLAERCPRRPDAAAQVSSAKGVKSARAAPFLGIDS